MEDVLRICKHQLYRGYKKKSINKFVCTYSLRSQKLKTNKKIKKYGLWRDRTADPRVNC